MKETITEVFGSLSTNILDPLVNGMQGAFPKLVWVAALIAIIALLCTSLSGRMKAGGVVTVLLIAFLWPYVPSLINGALGAGVSDNAIPITQEPLPEAAPTPPTGTLGDLDA